MNRKIGSTYARNWDNYVDNVFPKIQSEQPYTKGGLKQWQVLNHTDERYEWPGDEWGARQDVDLILQRCLFEPLGPKAMHVCEIGSGAGRYTGAVLERYGEATIHCFDVSQAFLEKLNARFDGNEAGKRLHATLLSDDPQEMLSTLRERGLDGRLDAMFSFDAMVHVELHTLAIYVASAAAALREGGVLTFNVGDATTDYGFAKLMHNAPGVFRRGGEVGGHFQWMSPDIVEGVLTRLGFTCGFLGSFPDCNARDLFVVARLTDRTRLAEVAGLSENSWWRRFAGGGAA